MVITAFGRMLTESRPQTRSKIVSRKQTFVVSTTMIFCDSKQFCATLHLHVEIYFVQL